MIWMPDLLSSSSVNVSVFVFLTSTGPLDGDEKSSKGFEVKTMSITDLSEII